MNHDQSNVLGKCTSLHNLVPKNTHTLRALAVLRVYVIIQLHLNSRWRCNTKNNLDTSALLSLVLLRILNYFGKEH
jgi:hypothetical protein